MPRRLPPLAVPLAARLAVLLAVLAAPASAGEIRGRVLVDGRPAGGVTVAALPFEDGFAAARREARREEPKALATAVSRPDGTFAVAVSGAADAVSLSFSGGRAAPRLLARLFEAGGDDAGDVRLAKAAPLAGRVADERGGPVVGATVTLWPGSGRTLAAADASPGSGPPRAATTGPDGMFRFETASEEGNRLRVEAPAFATRERAPVRAGALARPIVLALGQAVRGSVALPDRRTPAGGALVRFEGRTQTTRWTEARPDGTFLLEGVPREAGSLVVDGGARGRGELPLAAGSGEAPALVLAPTASIAGRVVDADSARPLGGVRVVARVAGGGAHVARSGPDGRYAVRGLPPRSVRLSAEDERFVPWSRMVAAVAGEETARDVPLVLGATLAGRVVDEEGAPIEGAEVQVLRGGENPFQSFVRRMEGASAGLRSGRDGTFRATRLPPGEGLRLDVRHDEYEERAVGGISLAPGATRSGLVVVLRRGLSVRGVVRDDEGRPLAGVEVTLSRSMTFRAGRGGAQVTLLGATAPPRRETGPDGRFEFRGLKSGDYTLSARRPGFARASVDPVNVGEGEPGEPVVLTLRPGVTISGFLRDRSGAGASGWSVSARAAGQEGPGVFGPGALRSEEPTGPDGAFLLEGAVAGETYDLQVMGPAGLGPRQAGVVAPAEGLELTVTGNGEIRGRVVDADSGRAIPDFQVRYQPDAQGGMRFVFRAGPGRGRGPHEKLPFHAEDGAFAIEDVPAGRWTVEAFAPGYQPGSAAGVVVEEGEAAEGVEIRLSKGGAIAGRVLESRTGRPVLDATVRAELSGGASPTAMVRVGADAGDGEAATDAEGRYEIAGLAPGTYVLTASHPDWSEATARVELAEEPASADIRLSRGGSLGGAVLASGRPVAGAQVSLSAAGDTGARPGAGFPGSGEQGALSDEGGRFRFDRLTPGRYTLAASLGGQSSPPVEAVLTGEGAQEVQLVLGEGALVRGVVTGLPDAQLAGVNVGAQGRDFFATTRTGQGGVFEVAGVPEGMLTLRANAGDFMSGTRSAQATVTIAPGQAEATAEIVFEAGHRVDGRVTRGGRPVTDAMVQAMPEGGGGRSASGRTDETGSFVLDGLGEGRHTLVASSLSGGAPIRRTVDVTGDATVDLEAPPARLAGMVVETGSERPIGDVQVRLEEAGEGMRFATVAATDSAGRFAFEDLEPKRYRVSFQKAAWQVETRELAATEEGGESRVEMRRGEGIALEARDGLFGTPLRGLFVRVVEGSGAVAFAGSVALDGEGRGEVPSLKAGTYALRAESSGYAPASLPSVSVPSGTLSLVLTPGGSLEIRVGPQTLLLSPRPAAAVRTPRRSGRARLPVERLHARREDRPPRPGAPDRERRARPLRARGRRRRASRRGRRRGGAERRRAALNRRPVRAGRAGPGGRRRREGPRAAGRAGRESRRRGAGSGRAGGRSPPGPSPAPPTGRPARRPSGAACPAGTRRGR
jgi:large repetitive protein